MAPKHGEKKEKAAAGSATKSSPASTTMRRLSEIPGVLEEGKIFFFYRQALFLSSAPVTPISASHSMPSKQLRQ